MARAGDCSRAVAAILLVWAGLLAGCSDGAGLLTTGVAGASDAEPSSAGQNGAGITASAGPFNPFQPEGVPVSAAGREVIANPTLADVLKPGPLPEFSVGRPDAPVVMVKYMSLTCQYCRRFMAETFPTFKREYIDTGKVRLIIREFPIGKTSGNATLALRCAPMDKYLSLYQTFLQTQAQWVSQEVRPEAILKVASQAGVTAAQFDACVKDRSLIAGLKAVKERGRSLGVIGTPNFFIANRLVKTVVGMPELRAIIDPMLAAKSSGATAKAG